MQNPAAVLERRLRREANPRRTTSLLRAVLVTLAIALPAFTGGVLTQRALEPPDVATVVRREGGSNGYYLPVHSRQLIVRLQPLVPSDAVAKQLAHAELPAQKTARELVSAQGLHDMAQDLDSFFPLTYRAARPIILPDELFDAQRKQYKTEATLQWLMRQVNPRSFRTVGVTYVDVFDDDYNFLFGQARLGGSVCVVSSARMGTNVGKKTPRQRYSAICAHELGHTLGLEHVKDRSSVMAYADSLEEHDTQGEAVTPENWERLKQLHPIQWDK